MYTFGKKLDKIFRFIYPLTWGVGVYYTSNKCCCYQMFIHLDTSFYLRIHLQCFRRLTVQIQLEVRLLDSTRQWYKSGSLWRQIAYAFLAINMFLLLQKESFLDQIGSDRRFSIYPCFCLNLSDLTNARAKSITSL